MNIGNKVKKLSISDIIYKSEYKEILLINNDITGIVLNPISDMFDTQIIEPLHDFLSTPLNVIDVINESEEHNMFNVKRKLIDHNMFSIRHT